MGAGGVTNHGTSNTNVRSLEMQGEPNSKAKKYNKKGKLVQERWYDENGKAVRNRDYSHSGIMNFPHDHTWDWSSGKGKRIEEHLEPDYENYK